MHDESLESQLLDVLRAHSSIASASKELLPLLSRELGFQWAVYWKLDEREHALKAFEFWHEPGLAAADLEISTRQRARSIGEGMPGRCWREGHAISSSDITLGMSLPRSMRAYSSGLRSGAWFPIVSDEMFYGVVELLKRDAEQLSDALLIQLDAIGRALGRAECLRVRS